MFVIYKTLSLSYLLTKKDNKANLKNFFQFELIDKVLVLVFFIYFFSNDEMKFDK